MDERPDPAQLAELVRGMSDDEVRAAIKDQIGVDTVLKEIFAGMEERFLPEKAGGVESTIQYNIKTDEGVKTWTVSFADGRCETREGAATSPRLTLELELVDFVRLIFGQAEGTQLFMTGKLRLQGDMMFAMQMQSFFDRSF